MTPRRATVLAMLAGCALIGAPAMSGHGPSFVWNASPSVPVGLYRVEHIARVEVTDLVAVLPPEPLAGFLAERGYLARNALLIKRVLATSGEVVCRIGATIFVHDEAYGEARERDTLGRPLPTWQGCRPLGDGEAFLMNWDAEDSFDGRYFGPVSINSIVARVIPVWTDNDGDGRFNWRFADPAMEP